MGIRKTKKGLTGSKEKVKGTGKTDRREKLKEKVDMYDMIIANIIAGKSIIEPTVKLDNSQLAIGFSNIASETQISKYFIIKQFPDYTTTRLIDLVRDTCIRDGVKINFFLYTNPYKIDWGSAEMRNKMDIWRKYSNENSGSDSVFDYRNSRGDSIAKERIIMSTKYLNEAELDHKRSLLRVAFVIEISAYRDDESILGMMESINKLKGLFRSEDIAYRELRVNMIDWIKALGIFSLKSSKAIDSKLSRKIVTDDILSNFNSFKQGRVGLTGVPLGMDVLSNLPVLKKFKADPDAMDNWLIAAESGGGKSHFVKTLISYLLADNMVVTVMDYEGDEYLNLAAYISSGNQDDAKVVSLGKSTGNYFETMEIPDLTGDEEVDCELKETSVSYTASIMGLIVAGVDGTLSQWEYSVISSAILRVYDSAGVTSDRDTWKRSKGLRIHMVYDEIKGMVDSKELVDYDNDNLSHKSAVRILESARVYFEEGESKYGTFSNPMSADELYGAKFIVLSFGIKGAASSTVDKTILALKQLYVAFISIQISNHCKYVRGIPNAKFWEEFQRWGSNAGSSEIIVNALTGGRKRGDINFIVTNDLASILDETSPMALGIRQNIQNMAIGKIKDKVTRHRFCETFDLQDAEPALKRIAKSNSEEPTGDMEKRKTTDKSKGDKYKFSFCLVLDTGKRCVVKVKLPKAITKSKLFSTGLSTVEKRGD